ncbi:MAG: hypothetical protein IPP17_30770 [Bacteroidetes bacterium]|nr:hypothetical protein [Bacteroidota bacterium]
MVSNLVFSVGTFMNERFIYMPSVGFCLLIGYVLVQKFPEWLPSAGKAIGLGLLGLMGLGFAVRTFTRVPDWKDAAAGGQAIKVSFNSTRSNQYYAYSLYARSLGRRTLPKSRRSTMRLWISFVNKALTIYPIHRRLTCRDGSGGRFQSTATSITLLPCLNLPPHRPVDFVRSMPRLPQQTRATRHGAPIFPSGGFGATSGTRKDAARAGTWRWACKLAPGDARLQWTGSGEVNIRCRLEKRG